MTPLQSAALTRLVQFGFDVLVSSVSDRDMIISVATNAPDWTRDKMIELCGNELCTFYTDLDRVHGYIYATIDPSNKLY